MVSLLRRTFAGVVTGVFALFLAASAVHAQTLINPSFETPVYSADNWYQNPTGAGIGWSFTGLSGIRYFATPNGSNGRQTAYLAAEGTTASLGKMTQTLTLPVGTYQVRYLAARGAGYDAGGTGAVQPVQFSVGPAGQTLTARGGAIYPRWNSPKVQPNVRVAPTYAESGFETWWTEPFTITSAGSYTIAFAATDPTALESQDSTTYIDEVVLVQTRAQFVNGGFEAVNADGMTPTGWSDLGYGVTRQSGVSAGGEGGAALRLVYAGGGSISQTITTPAGRYSVSARIRKDGAGYACPISITRTVNATATTLATLPPAPGTDFMAVTSDSFDLPAGTHLISFRCFSSTQWVYIDAVTLNTAGPSFANPSLESPTADNPAAVGYLQPGYFNPESGAYLNAPAGSSWSFAPGTTTAGFMRNPEPYVQGGSTQLYMWPYTTWGSQYAYLSSGWMEQTVALNSGRYVVLIPAAAYYQGANITVKVNGTTVATLPNVASPDLGFTERMTSSFVIATPGNYTIRFEGSGSMIDAPQIVQVNYNQPPTIAITAPPIASGKSYALVQGPTATGVTVSATATDPDGLAPGSLIIQQNGTQVGTAASASPFSVTLNPLAVGIYAIKALATDSQGLAAETSISLKVNNPPQGGFTLSPSGNVTTAAGVPVAVTVTPIPSDTDGALTLVEVLVDGAVQAACTKSLPPWACTLSLAARPAAYAVTVRATDDDGGVSTFASSPITINALPSVAISAPANGTMASAPASFSFTASASDSDGSIASVQYFNGGTAISAALTTAPYAFTWSAVGSGSYTMTARATDNRGGVSTSAAITVISNAVPTVAITAPATGTTRSPPASFAFTASASDADGSISQVQYFSGATLIGSASTSPYAFTWSNVPAGVYTITAKATDNRGTVGVSPAITVASNAAPTVSITAPASGTIAQAPASFAITTNAADADDGLAKVEFFNGATLLGTVTSAPWNFTWSGVASGVYSITAKATDTRSSATTSSAITLVSNLAPTVSITAPASGSIATAPASFTITTTAADGDDGIAKVEFFNGAMLIGTRTTAPWSFTWSGVAAGTYPAITAKVTDTRNRSTTSAAISLISNAAPTISLTAPTAGASFAAPATIALTANASDSDGSITRVDFYNHATLFDATTRIGTVLTGQAAAGGQPAQTGSIYTYNWLTSALGSQPIVAIATDNRSGASPGTPVVNVTINSASTTTLAVSPTVALLGQAITLTVTITPSAATGNVVLSEGGTALAACGGSTGLTLPASGPRTVSCTFTPATAGTHSYLASYAGTAFITASSGSRSVVVNTAPTISITAPASGTVAVAPATFAITTNAADADDGVAKVEFFNGATLIGTRTTAPWSFTWTSVATGSYSVTAKVTDTRGATATSAAVTLVSDVRPTISITAPASGTMLTAPASFAITTNAADTDDGIAKVEFFRGASLIGTVTSAPWSFTWSGVAAGSYSVTAKVTDTRGLSATSAAISLISNAAPTITITAPASGAVVAAPATFTFSATAADSDGTISKVEFFNGATSLGISASTASPYALTWASVAAGTYSITAKATDNRGAVITSPAISVISNRPPTVSISSPATGTVVAAPASFAITATATEPDIGDAITKVEFFNGVTLIGTLTSAPYTFNWSSVAAGSYSITAKATDSRGATATSTAITLISNTLPTVSITAPTNGTLFAAPATLALTATAADTDGSITKVEFFNGATLIGSKATSPYTFSWTGVAAGSYAVTAKATDNRNTVATSTPINLTVCAAPVVTLTAPANPQRIDVATGSTATVTLSASTSALGAGCVISKMEYYNGATLIATSTTSPFSTTWSGVAASATAYSIKARAYVGPLTPGTDSAVSLLTVNNLPTVTLTTPANNAFFAAPATIGFAATAADTGGTISSVQFLNGATSLVTDTTSPYSFNWTAVAAGSYSVKARATDSAGAVTDSTVAAITVCATPTAVLTAPTNNQVVQLATQTATSTVSLAATITAAAAGCINKVEYLNGTTVVATATAAPWSASWTNVAGGTYSVKARVHVVGSTTVFNDSAVATLYLNKPPLITLVTPSATQAALTAPGAITLSATATDTDPNVQSVSFFNGAVLIGTVNTGQAAAGAQPAQSGSTYNYVWTPGVGNYSVSAFATDGRLATAQTAANALAVCGTPAINLATPTVQPIVPPANSGVLNVTVTQPNTNAKCGTITQVDFFRTGTATPINTDPVAPYTYTVSGLTAGTTNYTAKVTDSAGRTATSASVALTVVSNLVPTVYLSAPASATTITYSPINAYLVTAKANDTDNGISSIQLLSNLNNLGAACSFTPLTPGLERTCSAALPAGTPVGAQSITAVASDGTASTTSAAVVVTIQPAPIVCTLAATTPVSGAATTVLANCQSGGANLPGVTIAWTGNCASSTTTTDASGNASCNTNALTVASNFSIAATRVNYSAANPAATIAITPQSATVAIASFSAGGQSGIVASVPSGTNAVVSLASTGTCSSGETVALSVNGTSLYGPGAPVGSVSFPITGAGVFQAVATRTCSAPVFSITSSATSLTVQAVTEPALADVETAAVTASLTANGEVAGAIPGSATVNPSGAVTYSIGVPVAPGSAGMQPSLALQYSSQGGRGIVGTGWSLSGFSTIHRCPATIVLDTFKGRVGFDGDDRYCLDGMRLITLGGLDGAAGTEYRTERDSYARIYSYGNSGTGPTSWTVETKSGQTLTFAAPLYKSNATGTSSDAGKIKAWGISRAEDTVGNYMTFAYTVNHNKGWMLPLSISYTGNTVAGTLPYATVELAYDRSAKNDSAVIYDGTGSYGEIPPVVTGITSKVDGLVSQQMNIEYESSPTTGRTRLKAVQMCGSGINTATGLCLQKTTFTYNNAAVDVATPWRDIGTTGFSVDPNPANPGKGLLALDLNGDGKTELFQSNLFDTAAYSAVISNATDACIQASICGVSGSQGIPVPLTTIGGRLSKLQLGDFNGDGVTDFVALISSIEFSAVRFIVCLGQAATPTVFACEVKLDWGSQNQYRNFAQTGLDGSFGGWLFPDFVVGDFDGDGRTDVLEFTTFQMYWDQFTGAPDNWMYFGGTDARKRPVSFDTTPAVDNLSLGDFDGDGRMDISLLTADAPTGYGTWKTWLSRTLNTDVITSLAGAAFSPAITTNGPRKHDYQPHIPDANGDGLADMLAFDDQTAPGADLGQFAYQGCMSRGNGTFECTTWRGPPGGEFAPFGPTNLRFSSVVFGDFNGDGRTDIAIADVDGSICNSLNQATFNCTIGQAIEGPKSWLICPSIPSASADSPRGRFDCGAGTVGNVLSGNGWWAGGLRRKGCTGVDPSGACVIRSYDLVVGGDFNGDGRTGLAGGTPLSGNPHITRPNIPDPVASIPDMLASVTNGLGFTNSFTYLPITDSRVYTKYNTGNSYPVLNIQTAMYVAATASHDDGTGGQQTYTYAYEGLKGHVAGGGTLGFAKVRVTDGKSQIVTETEYDNTYPARGLVKATRKWNAFTSLNESTTDYVLVRPYSNLAIHSYLPVASTEKSWDLNGAALPVTKTTSGYGALGSPINSAQWGTYFVGDVNTKYGCATDVSAKTYATAADTTEQFAKVSTNGYDNSTLANAWRLCRLRTARVVSSQNVYATETASEARNSSFDYNGKGLLKQEVVQPGIGVAQELTLTTNYAHDNFGNRVQADVVGWNGTTIETRTSKTTYDARGRFPLASENPMGPTQTESYTWDEKLGVQLTLTGPNGLTTTSKYDKLGRKVVERRADLSKSVMIYNTAVNAFGGLTVTSRTTGGGESSADSDKLGREVRKSVLISDNGTVRMSYVSTEYDNRGRVSRTSRPYWSTSSPVYPCLRHYDDLDRIDNEGCANDDGSATSTVTEYAYNLNALQTRVSLTANDTTGTPSTRSSVSEVDARGKSKKTTNTNGNTVEHAYDGAGNLTRTTRTAGTNGKMVTVIGYDLRGRKTSLSDPDTGSFGYAYNAFGELLVQTDAKLQKITSSYDALGRVKQRISDVDLVSNYTYDTCSKGIGKLCVVSASGTASPSGTTSVIGHQRELTYDLYGRLQSETTRTATSVSGALAAGARVYIASTTFDGASRVKQITYPNGQFVTRQYDATGAWNKLVGSTGTLLWQGGNADAEARWLNWSLGNGLTTSTAFGGNTGRLGSLTTSGGVQGLSLTYDGFGNIKSRLDAANGYCRNGTNTANCIGSATAETFVYDTLNQLTQANFLEGTQNIFYDGFGRMQTKTGINAVSGGYTYYQPTVNGGGQSHQVLTANGRTYTYDANGNVDTISNTLSTSAGRAQGTITLSWTSFNQPMTLPVAAAQNAGASATGNAGGVITLKYGADNQRVLEQLPIDVSVTGANQTANRFVLHSGASLFFEEDVKTDGSSEARAYLTGPLGVVAVQTTPSAGNATLTYWHRDHLGSLTVTTNEQGVVKDRMRFDPWGKPMTPLGARSGSGDRGFTGHEHLAGGLIHMNGRIYDPVLGRFLSADIVVQFPDAITSYNRYAYVMNNPLIYTDPSGYFIDAAIIATVLAAATVASVGVAIVQSYRGNDLNAERWTFAAMFFATAGATGPVAGVLQGFAAGGLQSGSIEGAIMGAMTAGALQGLGALAQDVLGKLGAFASAANDASASSSFRSTVADGGGGYVQSPVSGQPVGVGVSDATQVLDKVVVRGFKERLGDFLVQDPRSALMDAAHAASRAGDHVLAIKLATQAIGVGLVVGQVVKGGASKSFHPSTPVGRTGSWTDTSQFNGNTIKANRELNVAGARAGAPPINSPETIAGRQYSGHALDRMQQRGYVPSVVEDAISSGIRTPSYGGASSFYSSANNLTAVVNDATGRVVTVKGGR